MCFGVIFIHTSRKIWLIQTLENLLYQFQTWGFHCTLIRTKSEMMRKFMTLNMGWSFCWKSPFPYEINPVWSLQNIKNVLNHFQTWGFYHTTQEQNLKWGENSSYLVNLPIYIIILTVIFIHNFYTNHLIYQICRSISNFF